MITYDAVRKELRWARQHEQNPRARQALDAAWIAIDSPSLRIVSFPPAQAAAFQSFGDDMVGAAREARPPFPMTFYDFGFLHVGDYELAGATVVADGDAPWSAIAHLRRLGTDDWSSLYVFSTQLRAEGEQPTEMIGPGDRPVVADGHVHVICGALTFLESANVELVEAASVMTPRKDRGIPAFTVAVRQAKRRYTYGDDHEAASPDWSHRWEVRGHFKHFRKGPVFDRNADRRIRRSDGDEFVRVWCPPYVKGPDDLPLIPKVREVVA